jgi:hypothetical protein
MYQRQKLHGTARGLLGDGIQTRKVVIRWEREQATSTKVKLSREGLGPWMPEAVYATKHLNLNNCLIGSSSLVLIQNKLLLIVLSRKGNTRNQHHYIW